jgi:adenine-specific DNA-methyltransferase
MPSANALDLKINIQSALHDFAETPLSLAARNFFRVLGYTSQRDENVLHIATPNDFLQWLKSANLNNILSEKDGVELKNHLKTLHFIIQVTDSEIKAALGPVQGNLFDSGSAIDGSPMKSFLFFAALLTPEVPANRSTLARLLRLINKPLPMPAIILFRHGDSLTFAIINRRLDKRFPDRDVLEKVTLIKDISIAEPNRAQVEILHDLELSTLSRKHQVDNFVRLHDAWRKTLDISALNRKFYKELFNWYLFAAKTVRFPNPDKQPEEVNNSINVIRLLTRLIFCWFIKEKGLIPEALFNERQVKEILLDQAAGDGSAYYKAILQNLFFATLNTEMNRDNPGSRRFISERKYVNGFNPDYNNFTVYRHKRLFKDPEAALKFFENIPFLNGGLFECLDTVETGNGKNREIRYDGFSSVPSKQPVVPDLLFFGRMEDVDLSSAYNGKTGGHETVIGLIDVLNSYKFTIMENTPLEEEVALDPELLGKVFENLLASYNPETRSTARNQTGSFYTPREIVNYIVDESLKGYLEEKLANVGAGPRVCPESGNAPESGDHGGSPLQRKISSLFSHEQTGNPFSPGETEALINALSSVRILDPACGSGAFPMGMLHRMVHILGKLDPNNRKWKQAQIDIVEQDRQKALEMRDEAVREGAIRSVEDRKSYIEASFGSSHHELDYLRKLFLIENCIYGVDIQNIAVQIAKLRFFISLIVEQKRDDGKQNLGILAMPNLETKFVAADTLIGLEKPNQYSFGADSAERAEFELRQVRERIFYARKYKDKKELRKQEKIKREELEKALKQSGWRESTARQVAGWNPFDVAGSAPFFDPEMMFSLSGGFSIVIGNPPYVQIQSFSGGPEQKAWEQQKYATYTKTGDVYCLFYERGSNLLARGGILAYISSNKWMRANYGAKLREFFAVQTAPQTLIDFGGYQVFDSATVDTNILVLKKLSPGKERPALQAVRIEKDFNAETDIADYVRKKAVPLKTLSSESWIITSSSEYSVRKRIKEVGAPLKDWDIAINYGIKTGLNEAFIITGKKKDELIAQDAKSAKIIKPVLIGRDIKRYKTEFSDWWLINTFPALKVNINNYPAIRDYLKTFGKRLEQSGEPGCRKKTSNKWFEIQDTIAYHAEFEKEKIAWGNLALSAQFALAKEGMLINAPSTMITPASRYLLAVLNSSLGDYYIRSLGVSRSGGYLEYKPMFVEKLPVPKLDPPSQIPYEILVDCLLFAHEKGLTSDASTLEWVINVMVYGLYFSEEMKKDHCYINNRVAEVVKPFKPSDTDAFKAEYVNSLALFCLKDKVIYHGLIHSRNVEPVRIIHGEKK